MFEDRSHRPPGAEFAPAEKPPLLELGEVMVTPNALAALEQAGEWGGAYLERHQQGDWGDLCAEDRAVNQRALRLGQRLLSQYRLSTGEKLWILTEGDRSVTTVLLACEY